MKAFHRLFCLFVTAACILALFPSAQVKAADAPPEVEAGAYIVIDAVSGQVLIEKNAYQTNFPASITKILTLGLALEQQDRSTDYLNQQVEVSYFATHSLYYNSSHVALTENEVVSFQDLLYATQIRSANDAANVLAEYLGGSVDGFAQQMNQKVAQLGLTGSHFTNPSGLPDDAHYTTAYDMAQITRWALTVPGFRELFGTTQYTMPSTNKQPQERVFNGDNLMLISGSTRYYDGVIGSKQGYTTAARYTLATAAKRGDMELICIVLHCDRNEVKYDSTKALLDYCFDNFSYVNYPSASIPASMVPVYGGGADSIGEIEVKAGQDIPLLLHNSVSLEQVTPNLLVPEKYVMGQNFTPQVSFALNQEVPMQSAVLGTAPLAWDGIDAVLAANTNSWQHAVRNYPLPLLIFAATIVAVVLVVAGRVMFVKYRRHRRRAARAAAARARLPIRIAERPVPVRRGQVVASKDIPPKGRHSGKQVDLKVVYRSTAGQPPRRVGRMR